MLYRTLAKLPHSHSPTSEKRQKRCHKPLLIKEVMVRENPGSQGFFPFGFKVGGVVAVTPSSPMLV